MRRLERKRCGAQDILIPRSPKRRKVVLYDRKCSHYLSVIEDAVLACRKGRIGAIEAIDNIKVYLDVMGDSSDEGDVLHDVTKYLSQRKGEATAIVNSFEGTFGRVAGAGRGSSENEIPSAPHVE